MCKAKFASGGLQFDLYRRRAAMYMKQHSSGHLVEIMKLEDLYDPFNPTVMGRLHFGEEMQEPEVFEKTELVFLSNEPLPACWTNPHYRDHELRKTA